MAIVVRCTSVPPVGEGERRDAHPARGERAVGVWRPGSRAGVRTARSGPHWCSPAWCSRRWSNSCGPSTRRARTTWCSARRRCQRLRLQIRDRTRAGLRPRRSQLLQVAGRPEPGQVPIARQHRLDDAPVRVPGQLIDLGRGVLGGPEGREPGEHGGEQRQEAVAREFGQLDEEARGTGGPSPATRCVWSMTTGATSDRAWTARSSPEGRNCSPVTLIRRWTAMRSCPAGGCAPATSGGWTPTAT